MNDYTLYDPDNSIQNKQGKSPKSEKGPHQQSDAAFKAKPRGTRRAHAVETETPFDKLRQFFTSAKTRVIAGITIILLSGWLSVAALSFLKSGKSDSSLIHAQKVEQLDSDNAISMPFEGQFNNAAGPEGAKVSHHLFVEGFGYGSVVLIVYLIVMALALLGVRKIHFWQLTFKSLILAITISMVLGLIFIKSASVIPPGGYHGQYMNILLISKFGYVGAVLVSCLLVSIVVTIYLAQLSSLYNGYKTKLRTIRDKDINVREKAQYRSDRLEDSLSDSPIGVELHNEVDVKMPEVGTENDEIRIDLSEELIHDSEQHKQEGTEHFDRIPTSNPISTQPNADVNRIIPAPNATEIQAPGFEVAEEKEIEQGSGLPSALAAQGPYDPKADLSAYKMPSLTLMHDRPRKANSVDQAEQEENKERITQTLAQYNIRIDRIKATVGPTVTLYEIVPAEGVRIASIKRLEDDIAMSLAALGIRIIAPIPGKGTIGIEVPNKDPQTVSIKSILGSKAFQETKAELPMALGATISNDVFISDLTKMPHLLVAGATGQGKSVGLNTIIASLLYKKHPAELKFVLVDPKMVEFSLYACIEKHYLAKLPEEEDAVVTDTKRVVDTLNSLCKEMDDRYSLLKDAGCRSIIEYNTKFINRRLNPEHGHRYLPYIVMIVDEFADLIMTEGKAIETPIARIAQKARAVGMHMIIATQRPSTNIITGVIKANFPGRIGFRVSQMVDSRTILDSPGANQLIGRGDMLVSHNGTLERVQCAFIDTDEVEALCAHISNQIGYPTAFILPDPPMEASDDAGPSSGGSIAERDPLLEEVARWIVQGNTASTSSVQRRYSIGYNRAGKIMDQLERIGVVDKAQGGKPRRVLVDPMTLEDLL